DPTPHYDLGRLWLERTGLPMVFAVWACREPLHAGLAELEDALVASVRLARSEPEQLAHEASEHYGYPAGYLARYFEKLRYRFGPRERSGLMSFLELAHEAGELDGVPELRIAREAGVAWAARVCRCRVAMIPTSASTTTKISSARSRRATRSTCTRSLRRRSSTSRAGAS